MKTLVMLLALVLVTGCDNSRLERELAEVKADLAATEGLLAESQKQLAAERKARGRAERERAEIVEFWTERELAGKRLDTRPLQGDLERHLDALIRAVQRCLIIPPLREAFGERMYATLSALQKYRRALDRRDVVTTYQLMLAHSSTNMRRGADELEQALDDYGDGAGRAELEGLIRSTRAYASFVERATQK